MCVWVCRSVDVKEWQCKITTNREKKKPFIILIIPCIIPPLYIIYNNITLVLYNELNSSQQQIVITLIFFFIFNFPFYVLYVFTLSLCWAALTFIFYIKAPPDNTRNMQTLPQFSIFLFLKCFSFSKVCFLIFK